MTLDVQSLLVAMLGCVFATAVALPLLMGWRGLSTAARCVQASCVAQALAWLAFLSATRIDDRLLSSLSMGLLGLSFALVWLALRGWLGPRPGGRLLWALGLATPLGYFAGFGHYAFRVGWSNFGLAAQMAVVCVALAWPSAQPASRRWRALVGAAIATLAVVTAWRGVLGAFFTESYPHYRAPHPVNLAGTLFYLVALLLVTLGLLVAWREEAERELKRQAQTDGLTGLLNRGAFTELAAGQIAQARRHGDPLSLLMIDIDHFKRINDRLGHAAGDDALRRVADALRHCARRGDLIGRHGGEEFCVLLARAGAVSALGFDRRLRDALRRHTDAAIGVIGFSAGSAVLDDGDASLDDLLARADAALYRAKAEGRGRLVQGLPAQAQEALDLGV